MANPNPKLSCTTFVLVFMILCVCHLVLLFHMEIGWDNLIAGRSNTNLSDGVSVGVDCCRVAWLRLPSRSCSCFFPSGKGVWRRNVPRGKKQKLPTLFRPRFRSPRCAATYELWEMNQPCGCESSRADPPLPVGHAVAWAREKCPPPLIHCHLQQCYRSGRASPDLQ